MAKKKKPRRESVDRVIHIRLTPEQYSYIGGMLAREEEGAKQHGLGKPTWGSMMRRGASLLIAEDQRRQEVVR
jgi:hypothetical protein